MNFHLSSRCVIEATLAAENLAKNGKRCKLYRTYGMWFVELN